MASPTGFERGRNPTTGSRFRPASIPFPNSNPTHRLDPSACGRTVPNEPMIVLRHNMSTFDAAPWSTEGWRRAPGDVSERDLPSDCYASRLGSAAVDAFETVDLCLQLVHPGLVFRSSHGVIWTRSIQTGSVLIKNRKGLLGSPFRQIDGDPCGGDRRFHFKREAAGSGAARAADRKVAPSDRA